MVLIRVWLNRLWFGIHNKILNFHDWTLCYNELFHDNRRKWKSMDLSMDQWHSNNMKVILPNFAKDHCFWTLWTLNYVDCIPFSCIDYFRILFSNFWKTWSNLQLCGRVLWNQSCSSVHLSVCMSVMHFPQDLLCGFFIFPKFYSQIRLQDCLNFNISKIIWGKTGFFLYVVRYPWKL